jgi:hypothetical protein
MWHGPEKPDQVEEIRPTTQPLAAWAGKTRPRRENPAHDPAAERHGPNNPLPRRKIRPTTAPPGHTGRKIRSQSGKSDPRHLTRAPNPSRGPGYPPPTPRGTDPAALGADHHGRAGSPRPGLDAPHAPRNRSRRLRRGSPRPRRARRPGLDATPARRDEPPPPSARNTPDPNPVPARTGRHPRPNQPHQSTSPPRAPTRAARTYLRRLHPNPPRAIVAPCRSRT